MIYEFTPTQDLHGYDEPWAPGAGDQMLDYSTATTLTTTIDFKAGIDLTGGESYTISYKGVSNARIIVYTHGTSTALYTSNYTKSYTIAPEADATVDIRFYNSDGLTMSENLFMMNEGKTALPFAPYANICLPEGYNIWDPTQSEMIPVYSGYVDAEARKLYLHPVYEEYDGEELVGPWMSSLDEYTEDGTPTEGAFVIDFGGDVTEYTITDFMLQTLLDSLGIRRFITSGATLLNSLMDQAQGRVRSEEELLHLSRPLNVIDIGDQLPAGLTFKPISKDVLPGLPGKFIR